jgi:hypothetical protein
MMIVPSYTTEKLSDKTYFIIRIQRFWENLMCASTRNANVYLETQQTNNHITDLISKPLP